MLYLNQMSEIRDVENILKTFMHKIINIIVVCGATGSGKSALVLKILSKVSNAIIINADSMQIYKEIPILTAQPTNLAKHHLYSILSCNHLTFSVAEWLSLSLQ